MKILIDFLRANGVSAYKNGDMELMLLETEPFKPEIGYKLSAEEVLNPPRKGADGLTAEEQEMLYGAVLDAEQPK